MNKTNLQRLFVLVILISTKPVMAEHLWKGTIELDNLVCKKNNDTIVVDGVVTLFRSDDLDPFKKRKTISVLCGDMKFLPNAEIHTLSDLDIRLNGEASGAIKIVSTRGVAGEAAPATPEIWEESKARDGSDRGKSRNGNDADACIEFGSGPQRGRDGQRGEDGFDGRVGSDGADGKSGARGSDITFLTNSFAEGTTVEILTHGGDGGDGGLGGRGQDGGDGGKGGAGGNAGDNNECHSAANGGRGGNGGDGGDGGDGGRGGNGGNGGDGGNILVGLKNGGGLPVTAPKLGNEGGMGGDPGLGGEPGEGGTHGKGGGGGAGSGDNWLHSPGSSGSAGADGVDGRDGDPGPDGLPGSDGRNGRQSDGSWGTLPDEKFEQLVPKLS